MVGPRGGLTSRGTRRKRVAVHRSIPARFCGFVAIVRASSDPVVYSDGPFAGLNALHAPREPGGTSRRATRLGGREDGPAGRWDPPL